MKLTIAFVLSLLFVVLLVTPVYVETDTATSTTSSLLVASVSHVSVLIEWFTV
jgi:hypothetical protein